MIIKGLAVTAGPYIGTLDNWTRVLRSGTRDVREHVCRRFHCATKPKGQRSQGYTRPPSCHNKSSTCVCLLRSFLYWVFDYVHTWPCRPCTWGEPSLKSQHQFLEINSRKLSNDIIFQISKVFQRYSKPDAYVPRVLFFLFTCVWIVTRLIYYPLFVIKRLVSTPVRLGGDYWILFNLKLSCRSLDLKFMIPAHGHHLYANFVLLLMFGLFFMHLIWTWYILKVYLRLFRKEVRTFEHKAGHCLQYIINSLKAGSRCIARRRQRGNDRSQEDELKLLIHFVIMTFLGLNTLYFKCWRANTVHLFVNSKCWMILIIVKPVLGYLRIHIACSIRILVVWSLRHSRMIPRLLQER